LVASPQRRDCFHGCGTQDGGGAVARSAVVVATADGQTTEPIPSQPNKHDYQQRTTYADMANIPSSGKAENCHLAAENAKLRQEVNQLNETLELLQTQFDVDRRGFLAVEMVAQQERQKRELVEQKLLTETSDQRRISDETALLRQQLEREQQKSEVQSKGIDDMLKRHENYMQAKDSELRVVTENLQSEQHQVRLLEEQLQHCRGELEFQRDRQWQSQLMPAVATVAIDAKPALGVADPQEPISLAEGRDRRLFPSIVDDQMHSLTAPLSVAASPGISMQFVHELRKFQSPSPRSGTDAARGRTLNSARTGSCKAPWANLLSGGVLRDDIERPLEQQRAASSAPRFGGRMGFCSLCQPGHTRSAGDLMPQRSASNTGSYVSMAKRDEAPPPGCVADRVTMFEQRCRTPRRESSDGPRRGLFRSGTPESCTCRSSREDLSRATQPTVPRALQRSRPTHGEMPSAGRENCQDSQIFLGMSPMGKCQSRESFTALSSLKVASMQSSAPASTAKSSEGSPHVFEPVPQHGLQANRHSHNGRDSSVPEVPVHERIRQFQDR